MKITDINLKIYRWERSTPITNGLYTYTHNVLNIVEIQTEDKLSICEWENDKPIYEDVWLEIDDIEQDDNKEFVSIIT